MASTTSTRRRRRSKYNALPSWITRRRLITAAVLLMVGLIGTYGLRTVLALSHLFHENPISVLRDLLPGGHGSQLSSDFASGQRVNIALYGYPNGEGGDGLLTDSIMVVSVQPRPDGAPQIAEISIPRDWWVPIDLGNGQSAFGRINEAYESGQIGAPFSSPVYKGDHGGGAMAGATLERMLGIHIDHFIGVDYTAFKAAVDAVGGIDINVEHTFTDYEYPHGECPPDCGYMTVHFDAGRQHMDGDRALIFARSRKSTDNGEGSNFARNKRQQLVLSAVKQKVLSIGGLSKLPDLLNSLGDHVVTDLALGDALSLYDAIKDVDNKSIVHVSIDDSNFIYECGYPSNCDAAIEYPHDRTFASLHHYIRNLFVDPAVLSEAARVTVVDGTGRGEGASGRWAALLGDIGFRAADGSTGASTATTRVIDHSGGHAARTAKWLAQYFGTSVESSGPGSGGGVTLILGQDEERAFNDPTPALYARYFSGSGSGTPYTGTSDQSAPAARRSAGQGRAQAQPSSASQAAAPPPRSRPTPTPCPILICP